MQIEPWYLGPVTTYRVDKHKERGDIRQQTTDRRQTAPVNRKHKTEISKHKNIKRLLVLWGEGRLIGIPTRAEEGEARRQGREKKQSSSTLFGQ
jgi:hypothetical protein